MLQLLLRQASKFLPARFLAVSELSERQMLLGGESILRDSYMQKLPKVGSAVSTAPEPAQAGLWAPGAPRLLPLSGRFSLEVLPCLDAWAPSMAPESCKTRPRGKGVFFVQLGGVVVGCRVLGPAQLKSDLGRRD